MIVSSRNWWMQSTCMGDENRRYAGKMDKYKVPDSVEKISVSISPFEPPWPAVLMPLASRPRRPCLHGRNPAKEASSSHATKAIPSWSQEKKSIWRISQNARDLNHILIMSQCIIFLSKSAQGLFWDLQRWNHRVLCELRSPSAKIYIRKIAHDTWAITWPDLWRGWSCHKGAYHEE